MTSWLQGTTLALGMWLVGCASTGADGGTGGGGAREGGGGGTADGGDGYGYFAADAGIGASAAGNGDPASAGTSSAAGSPDCEQGASLEIQVGAPSSGGVASPTLVLAMLDAWSSDRPLPVRPAEFLNRFVWDWPEGVGVRGGAMRLPVEGDHLVLFQAQVRSPMATPPAARAIALVVDTAPSTSAFTPLSEAIEVVTSKLRASDVVAVFTRDADLPMRPFSPVGELGLLGLVDDLGDRRGGRALAALVSDALDGLAAQDSALERIVVVVGDGRAGLDDAVLAHVQKAARDTSGPVRVIALGVGPAATYADEVFARLVAASRGTHLFFEGTEASSKPQLGEQFEQVLDVARRGVRLRLTLPDHVEPIWTTDDTDDPLQDEFGGSTATLWSGNLAPGTTMTLQQLLRFSSEVDATCASIGWTLEDDQGLVHAASEPVAPLMEPSGVDDAAPHVRYGWAVTTAAQALRGPTPRRLASAISTLDAVRLQSEGGSPALAELGLLCSALRTACLHQGAECPTCEGIGAE